MKRFNRFSISVQNSSEIERYVEALSRSHNDLPVQNFIKILKHISLSLNDRLEHNGTKLNYDALIIMADGTIGITFENGHMELKVMSNELVVNGIASVSEFTL